MKIVALDLGDAWTGIAISDGLGIIARPYNTVATENLFVALEELFAKERITTVVVGYPKTMRGTQSEQTKKIVREKEVLEQKFPNYTWILWDERLSSKRAAKIGPARTKQEKLLVHARAAASILDTYLQYRTIMDNTQS